MITRAVQLTLAAVLATVASMGVAAAPSHAVAPRPQLLPADHRIYMVSDSVGLGAVGAMPRALPDYQVTLDGTPALFVEQFCLLYTSPSPRDS